MDGTLAQIINHLVMSDAERARLTERVKQLEAQVEQVTAESKSLHDELDALHAEASR